MTDISGPFNLEFGNSARFAIEYLDSNGSLTVPSTASLNVTYINRSNASQTDNVALALTGSFWVGTWSSTSASLGLATWVAASAGTSATANGTIRVLQRQSTY